MHGKYQWSRRGQNKTCAERTAILSLILSGHTGWYLTSCQSVPSIPMSCKHDVFSLPPFPRDPLQISRYCPFPHSSPHRTQILVLLRIDSNCLVYTHAVKKSGCVKSYLTGRDELQRPEGSLQVLCVALQVEESTGDRGLQLGGVLPRRRVRGDLVDSSHYCRRATDSWLCCGCCLPCRGLVVVGNKFEGLKEVQLTLRGRLWDRDLGASLSGRLARCGLAPTFCLGDRASRDRPALGCLPFQASPVFHGPAPIDFRSITAACLHCLHCASRFILPSQLCPLIPKVPLSSRARTHYRVK